MGVLCCAVPGKIGHGARRCSAVVVMVRMCMRMLMPCYAMLGGGPRCTSRLMCFTMARKLSPPFLYRDLAALLLAELDAARSPQPATRNPQNSTPLLARCRRRRPLPRLPPPLLCLLSKCSRPPNLRNARRDDTPPNTPSDTTTRLPATHSSPSAMGLRAARPARARNTLYCGAPRAAC
jgi:hypothetical protein